MDLKSILLSLLILVFIVSAEEGSGNLSSFEVIDIMNAFLILVCSIFVFAIVGTLRNRRLLELVRSAHFFKIKRVITAWTLFGSAVLLYALIEILFAFKVIDDVVIYKVMKTIFGVLFAAGLFIQYVVVLKYVKQAARKTTTEDKEKKG
ncbi:MAG: hypothetical protein JW778_06845 [Candidatus Altiarchaeota archaeon]|nr:hypothetical protein [Candidatus Altiarchaeota archaeon]